MSLVSSHKANNFLTPPPLINFITFRENLEDHILEKWGVMTLWNAPIPPLNTPLASTFVHCILEKDLCDMKIAPWYTLLHWTEDIKVYLNIRVNEDANLCRIAYKQLPVHVDRHWVTFYADYTFSLQGTYNPSQNILRPTPNGLIFCSFLWKHICSLRKGNNISAPSPDKAMLFPNDHFHSKKSSHHTHNIALSGEGAENRCSLRIFVKDRSSRISSKIPYFGPFSTTF